ncbi:gamma-glutamyltransferase [Chelatococcus asaccharovorans]|uniref:Glutathione hydrolase proenzyme n=1 Tax=Chelatococcus asaccharovorans TaxID=28210 RepID=A0A2V3UBL2_9HYPH|nr:gamma-glutamyltransferase [Chelatococcus asaccharovorans]MBS7703561.1 gamma-glutamyltransferase [Chelatococcus asaccharovorans]PXW61903.1 gamma-glutamyltransferase 1 [Chelatococcus asaccharovorans]
MSQFRHRCASIFGIGRAALLGLSVAALGVPSGVAAQTLAPAPEGATVRTSRNLGEAHQFMVAAANPLAAEAGREILRAGGSAVDAAIAVQLVLNLVEPQSSGLGGGAFMLHWDAAKRALLTLDGREIAPASATPELFLTADGKPMPFMEAVVGGRSVGVPGTPRLLEAAHKRWGRLPWARLFEPAIRLADEGFAISPRLNGLLSQEQALRADVRARAYFYGEDGNPKAVGAVLKSPAMAATLRTLARDGMDAFYSGAIAEDIVATVAGHAKNPGGMTLADLKSYAIAERPAVCHPYRVYTVCGMGPPSSGGIGVAQILTTLATRDLARMGQGAEAVHWIAEAGRLAYADRAQYLGDPDFLAVPVRGLLDADYLRDRAALVRPDRSMGKAAAGEPPFARRSQLLAPSDGVENGTSHISVVDATGNAVSMTTTIESGFGARIMTASGFLMNNELTDFNFAPSEAGKPVANRVEPGKRPRSSMAPTIVFDAFDRLFVITGSPGGSQIINFVAKTLVAILDWKLDPQVAVDWPNVGSRNGPTELEAGTEAEGWKAPLEALGHQVSVAPMTSGTQAIVLTPSGFLGGADSRREGVAIGD